MRAYVKVAILEMGFFVKVAYSSLYTFDSFAQIIISRLDVNECSLGYNSCDYQAECINLDGGYKCKCSEGYTGNGYSCIGKL